jgi:hypothetical protein
VAAAAACSGEGRLGRLGERDGELEEGQGGGGTSLGARGWPGTGAHRGCSGEAPVAARFAAGGGLRVGVWAAAPL